MKVNGSTRNIMKKTIGVERVYNPSEQELAAENKERPERGANYSEGK